MRHRLKSNIYFQKMLKSCILVYLSVIGIYRIGTFVVSCELVCVVYKSGAAVCVLIILNKEVNLASINLFNSRWMTQYLQ